MFARRSATAAPADAATPPSAMVPSSASRWSTSRRMLAAIASRGLWAALIWLHAYLLWQRIVDLTLFEPLVALRWGAAALIVLALVRLQRLGMPLFRGRRALVLWLVILLLHAGSAAVGSQQQVVAEAGLLIAVSLWLLALEGVGQHRRVAGLVLRRHWLPRLEPASFPCAPGSLAPLSPRPPPLT